MNALTTPKLIRAWHENLIADADELVDFHARERQAHDAIATLLAALNALGSKEPKAQQETGWLLEHEDINPHQWLAAIKHQGREDGVLEWVTDSSKALRFARKQDAIDFAWLHAFVCEKANITEHMWCPHETRAQLTPVCACGAVGHDHFPSEDCGPLNTEKVQS